MALVQCTQCGKKFSSDLSECPECGNPASNTSPPMHSSPQPVTGRVIWMGKWHLRDALVAVFLDGIHIGTGSCKHGGQVPFQTVTGHHKLEIKILREPKPHHVFFPEPGDYEVEIRYSRMWGDFVKPCKVRRVQ